MPLAGAEAAYGASVIYRFLTLLIQEKYNDTLGVRGEGESETAYQFRNGQNFAYYDTLDLLHSQLLAFGIPTQELEPGVPALEQPAVGKA